MAEFKLGRIKFVYQGTWAPSVAYVVDDVVTVGGKTYICVTSNTSSAIFGTDFNSGYWNIVADGSRWSGTWTNGTYYQLGDQVLYGGVVYQCTTAHTSATSTATLTATGFTVNTGTGTVTFTNASGIQPYLVGSTITLAGFSPSATSTPSNINTTFTVTACTATSVSFAITGTYTVVTLGTVAGTSQLGLEANQSAWTTFAANFNWIAGGWVVNSRYKVRDLVTYNGVTYVCNTGHISAATTALGIETSDSAKWDIFNAGLYYVGTWAASTRYRLNDIVKAGASLWICTTQHSSTGTTIDTTKFTMFVNGVEFLNVWSSSTNYVIGDIITYGGNTYTSILNGINQNPSTATSYWQLFTAGFSFQNDWSNVTSYKIGSVVRLGGYTYLATADNAVVVTSATATTTSTNVITVSSNANLVAGLPIVFTGTTFGNIISGTTYYVLNPNAGANQITVSAQPNGTVFPLATASGTMTATTNPSPPFSTYWTRLNSGIRWNANTGTYTPVSATNVTGTGSSATFTVLATKTNYVVTLGTGGSGYSASAGSNTIKLLGSSLGGLSPANDVTITITGVSAGAITTFTSTGYSVTWASSIGYVLGDAVYFGANSYICINAHISTSGNRPDADTVGTYWNLLASGSESAVLTTTGDLVYYGASGPTRLPVGQDGQILRVTGSVPGWAYYGLINNIVYVSPAGIDTTVGGQGLTIDKPWATIRYACYQIENGYLNPNSTSLLQINKQFILKEVNNYVRNQYSVNVTSTSGFNVNIGGSSTSSQTTTANLYIGMPITFSTTSGNIVAGTTYYVASINSSTQINIATSYANAFVPTLFSVGTGTTNTGTYDYSSTKTERDTGLILDGIIYDIGHAGNWRTVTNTQAYFAYPYPSSTLASGVQPFDLVPFTAALNYMNTLAGAVLNNAAPTSNYQALNGISSGNRAIQNTTSGVSGAITSGAVSQLISIVTTALSTNTTVGIASLQTPNTTISVKTGTYNEILPIVVPSYTAVVGDELRSTVVQPAPAIATLVNDKPKSIATLTRIQSTLSNLITNATVTPTTGNVTAQVTSLPAGDTGSSASANALLSNLSIIQNMISNGLQQAPSFSFTNPSNYNTSYLVGYGYGTAQIAQNYNFIKAEIAAYLNTNYSSVWTTFGSTNQTETLRDVGFVLDGLQYDMTYGCNNQSLVNGSAYYSLQIPQILTAYSAATTAALQRLQTIIVQIATATTVTPSSGNTVVQLLAGTAGSSASGAFAQARVGDILYWLANGKTQDSTAVFVGSSSSSTTLTVSSVTSGTISIGMCITGAGIAAGTYITGGSNLTWTMSVSQTISAGTIITGVTVITPVTSGAYALTSSTLQGVYTNLQLKKSEIASDAQAYVVKYYQQYPISSALTNRDAGLVVDALSWDLLLGSNANSIAAGRAFNRLNTSATALRNNVNNELTATLAALTFIGFKAKLAAANGSVAQASLLIDDIITTINGQAQVTTFATSITNNNITLSSGANVTVGNTVVFGGNFGNLVQGTTYYVLTSSSNIITVSTAYSGSAFVAGSANVLTGQVSATFTPTLTTATTSTNLLTLTSTYGMSVNMPISFTSLPAVITASATATSSSGNLITLGASAFSLGIAIGQQVYFTGIVFGNLAPNQMYYVLTAVGSTISVSLTNGGSSINLITASGTMTVNANNAGNLWNNNVYWINSISGNQITVTSTFKSGTAYPINNTISGMSAVGTAGYISKVLYLNNPMINGSNSYNNSLSAINGTEIIRANIPFLAADAVAYTLANYGGGANALTGTTTSTNVITTSANHNFIIGDPVQFSATTVTTSATSVTSNVITVTSTANMVVGMPIVFSGTGFGNIVSGTTYYILTIPGGAGNGTTITVCANQPGGSTFVAGTGTGTMSVSAGGLFGNLVAGTTYYVLTTPSLTTFTVSTVQAGTGTQTSFALTTAYGIATANYYFNSAKCTRDTTNYLNAIIYDINYLGNYKTQRAAELYVNAVAGSTSSNMYLVRNSCGLRNQTLNGIVGYLGGVNSFGTKRPTGGAFTSLDPGYGPNDTNVQILTRSTYVQNCTMFGYAAVGAKVDGALHSAGNKSIVANDYTCVIGDGIGWWNTGSGSLAELVSVFNYYSYAGYLAELGGRIRATNGNSSYGTYGVVSETVDTFETPIYGTINNRSYGAQVTNVVTDSTTQILCLEYEHTGLAYTNSVALISGTGYNILATQDEFRDAAVTENRLVDLNNNQGVGGTYYVTVTNVAQGGATGYITIAATDSALTGAYNGMRIQLTAGTAVGQYANILSYSNGSKVAQIIRPTFATLTITATTTGSPGVATVASTATLYTNMPFYVGTAVGGLTVQTVYYVRAVINASTFSVTTQSGGTADPINATTTSQTSAVYAAGWDHIVAGTPLGAPDLTSAYIIEPAISFTSPGYTATARTMPATASWTGVAYGAGSYVAISNGTSSAFSTTGKSWTAGGTLPASTTWNQVTYAGGQGASVSVTVGGFGGSGAVLTATLGTGSTLSQVVSVTVVNGGYNYTTSPTITFTPTSGGSGATAVATVLNGSIASVTITINGSGYTTAPTVNVVTSTVSSVTPVTYGKNYLSTPTVALTAPFSGTVWSSVGAVTNGNYYYYYNGSTQATNYYQANASGNFNSSPPTFTSGTQATGYGVSLTYVGTLATVTPVLSNGGVGSYTLTNGGFGYTSVPTLTITDAASKFVAISLSGNSAYLAPTSVGANWTAGGSLPSANFTGLAWGNGVYVAVGGTSTTPACASSADGAATWVSRSIPGAVTYSAVAWGPTGYGNASTSVGLFVAISTGSNLTAYSTNGTTWAAGGNLPASTTWTSIAWGNGRFVAVASGGTTVAYSYDGGATWRASTVGGGAGLPVSQSWNQVVYGAGLFVAISTSSAISATSSDGINWVGRAMPSSSNWSYIAYGNPTAANGVNPLWVAVSSTSGTIGASIHTGATTTGRVKVSANVVSEIRMWEPGSGYPKGIVSATSTISGGTITVDNTENLAANQPIEFSVASGNLAINTTYYVISGSITSTTFQVASTSGSVTPVSLIASTPTGMYYTAGPLPTITDPNRVYSVAVRVRTGDGALGQPSFANRGSGNATATATQTGDGYSDLYQNSAYINVANLYSMPSPGANVQFSNITGANQWYKLVIVTNILGIAGNYTAQFQVSPALSTLLAPAHGTLVTTRLKYSQVRLTGHDFLYTGTGNQTQTNYPNVNVATAIQANQQYSTGGGRNFFTSTDQDGNFNVGNLFGVQQATGTASLNANAFNLAGLQSLTLSGLALGAGSATITQFSTDPYFTANSDNIVPTQKAIKSYISAQIGGGQSQLNVNTLTAGQIFIANNTISNTTGNQIYVSSKMNFAGGIDGAPVALVFFGQH